MGKNPVCGLCGAGVNSNNDTHILGCDLHIGCVRTVLRRWIRRKDLRLTDYERHLLESAEAEHIMLYFSGGYTPGDDEIEYSDG